MVTSIGTSVCKKKQIKTTKADTMVSMLNDHKNNSFFRNKTLTTNKTKKNKSKQIKIAKHTQT